MPENVGNRQINRLAVADPEVRGGDGREAGVSGLGFGKTPGDVDGGGGS